MSPNCPAYSPANSAAIGLSLALSITSSACRHTRSGRAANVLAASLGIVTPFSSCSAVPLFIGFLSAGVPLGVTFSFLISAPMVNEVALVLLFGMFGWQVAALYLAMGLLVAIVSGLVNDIYALEGRQRGKQVALEINDSQVGSGYGQPTPAMIEAVELVARTEGILLDPVYTGKAMAGLVALVRSGAIGPDQTVVFWHTGGAPGLYASPEVFQR